MCLSISLEKQKRVLFRRGSYSALLIAVILEDLIEIELGISLGLEKQREREEYWLLWIMCFGPNPVLGASSSCKSSRRETRWYPV